MSGKKDEDIDDFVFKYSGVKVVHLEHFNKENFRQKALALGRDLINVAKFLRLKQSLAHIYDESFIYTLIICGILCLFLSFFVWSLLRKE